MSNQYEVIVNKSPLTFDVPNWLADYLEVYAEKMLYERWDDISLTVRRSQHEPRLVPFIALENCFLHYSPMMGTFFRWLWIAYVYSTDLISKEVIEFEEGHLHVVFRDINMPFFPLSDIDDELELNFPDSFGISREELSGAGENVNFGEEELKAMSDEFIMFAIHKGVPSLRELIRRKRFVHFEVLQGTSSAYLLPDIMVSHSYANEFRTSSMNDGEGGCYVWLTPQVEVW